MKKLAAETSLAGEDVHKARLTALKRVNLRNVAKKTHIYSTDPKAAQ